MRYIERKALNLYNKLMDQEAQRTKKDGGVTRRDYDRNGRLARLIRPTNTMGQRIPDIHHQLTGIKQFQVRYGTTMITGNAASQSSFWRPICWRCKAMIH